MATLKQKKANPNSKYWFNKASKEWSNQVKAVGECEVCHKHGTARQEDDMLVAGLQSHHIIKKGPPAWREKFQFDLSNGACLCDKHHSKYETELSPHGTEEAQFEWWIWLRIERPGQYEYYLENKNDKRMPEMTYKQMYDILKGEQK